MGQTNQVPMSSGMELLRMSNGLQMYIHTPFYTLNSECTNSILSDRFKNVPKNYIALFSIFLH